MSLPRLSYADGIELAAASPYEILVGIWRFRKVRMRFSDSKRAVVILIMVARVWGVLI